MSKKGHRVSVVIRTRDVEKHFRELLWRLSCQSLRPSELVVVDNFSSDPSLDKMFNLLSLAKKEIFDDEVCVKLAPLTSNEFSHAYSSNVGVFVASCDLVCMTNGHSLPISNMWLERGVAPFKEISVAGVAGYSTPHKDGTVWEKIAYEWGWKRLNEVSRAYVKDDFFSTVNCVLRKPLWEKYPFDETLPSKIPYSKKFGGEDHDWAREMLARGYNIVLEPKFDVYHSHGETPSQLFLKYLIWRQIKKKVESFTRPRNSFSKLNHLMPSFYDL